MSGVIAALYSQDSWPQLTQGLASAMSDGDGSLLLMFADQMSDRNPDGSYETNADEAFLAINCLDYPVTGTPEEWDEQAEQLAEVSPLFGAELGYGDLLCSTWPVKSTRERAPITAAGTGPILVIGTTGDPATPYRWSEALASQLKEGHLLTFEGEGHTAYGPRNSCVAEHVDSYFIDDTVPRDGTRCS